MKVNPFFKVKNNGSIPEIFINGIIGEDADFASFRDALVNIINSGNRVMKMVINSGGGSMTEGFAYYDLLKQSGMIVKVDIIGLAASMAGVLSQAASPGMLCIHDNASVMCHKPQSGADGESGMLRSMADYADKLEAKAVKIYASRTGKTEDEVKEWFKPGTMKWFTAEEAVAAGICDCIIKNDAPKAKRIPQNFTNANEVYTFYNSITQNPKTDNMKKNILVLNAYKVQHTLTDESTDDQVSLVVENALKANAAAMQLKDEEITKLKGLMEASNVTNATTLVKAAIKDGKIKAEDEAKYIEKATKDYDFVSNLFAGLQGRVDPKTVIALGADSSKTVAATVTKTYNQHSESELRDLKKNDFATFKALFKAEYGQEFEG